MVTNTSSTGTGVLTSASAVLTRLQPTTITTQPLSQTVALGDPVTLTVAATASGTVSYQWKKGTANVPGGTQATLVFGAVLAVDAAVYTCVVTNTSNSNTATATSSAATLTVNLPPSIKTPPATQTQVLGSAATFSVVATASGTLSYQWRKDGSVLPGATATQLAVPAVQADRKSTRLNSSH